MSTTTDDTPNCSKCGCGLANDRAKRAHERVCDGGSAKQKVEEALSGWDYDYDTGPCVYVITVSYKGRQFYYVGQTLALKQRLLEHTQGEMAIVVPDGDEMAPTRKYDLVDVHDIEPVSGGEYARRKRERERAYEIAIETGRTDILGGA